MWLMTIYGFFSIAVADKTSATPNHMMVRAREEQHLQNLIHKFKLDCPLLSNKDTDYAYRIIVPKATWLKMLGVLGAEQTWSNFKDQVAKNEATVGRSYLYALHDVWSIMYGLQTIQGKWRGLWADRVKD